MIARLVLGFAALAILAGCGRDPIATRPCYTPYHGEPDFPRPPIADRYFTPPELGPRTLATLDETEIRTACPRLREEEHDFLAAGAAHVLQRFGEPDLRNNASGRVLRVVLVRGLSDQAEIFRLEERDGRRTLRTSWIGWRTMPPRPSEDMTAYEAWDQDHQTVERRDVVPTPAITREIWALQRDVQPTPAGFVGVTDLDVLIVETMRGREREARAVTAYEPTSIALLRALWRASGVTQAELDRGHHWRSPEVRQ